METAGLAAEPCGDLFRTTFRERDDEHGVTGLCEIDIVQRRYCGRVDVGVIGTYDGESETFSLPLHVGVFLMGDLEAVLTAMVEAVATGCHLMDDVLDIATMIDVFYSGKQPAALLRKFTERLFLDDFKSSAGYFHTATAAAAVELVW